MSALGNERAINGLTNDTDSVPASSRFSVDKVQSPPKKSVTLSADNTMSGVNGKCHNNNSNPKQPLSLSRSFGRFEVERTAPGSSLEKEEEEERVLNGNDHDQGLGIEHRVRFQMGNNQEQAPRNDAATYATANLKSFRNVETMERAPHIDHYRNLMSIEGAMVSRPTLAQLHEHDHDQPLQPIRSGECSPTSDEQLQQFRPPDAPPPGAPKFGWVKGVFMRCVLNILGVMLYLRISWVAGQCGVLVTSLTSLSMSAIATNGRIKGGGCYFMISRALGPEYGGSIGLIFAFANSVGAAMYIVGFAETVRDLLAEAGWQLVDGQQNDVRIIALVTCCVLMGVCLIGVSFEAKMQLVLLVVLAISLVNYVVALPLPPTDRQMARGVTNLNVHLLSSNLLPAFSRGHDFFSVFGVFFPAATGIMAGANISGDLANPEEAIPKGTLCAVAVTTVIYVLTVWMSGATSVRYASGVLPLSVSIQDNLTLSVPAQWYLEQPLCALNDTCAYGLMNSAQVMQLRSLWGPLITAGVFAATLSSALASLVSAPKIFQAVCKDGLFPYIDVFAKGYGAADEPRRAYALGFVLALLIILIGDLNAIAPIISNFFLASYALINYSCFDMSFSKQPGFRPAFRFYNLWLSLLGALLCLAVMFVISWWTALLTFACIAVLWSYLRYRKPDVNWGSSTQAHSYKAALESMYKLQYTEEHVKNYRPQVLVLTGNPVARPSLVDFACSITKDSSLLVCGHVFAYDSSERVMVAQQRMQRSVPVWLRRRRVRAFYAPIVQPSLRQGVQCLLQSSGLGRLRPNIVLLGYKTDWTTCEHDQLQQYMQIVHDCFDLHFAVAILRVSHGLDMSGSMKEHNVGDLHTLSVPERTKLSRAVQEQQNEQTQTLAMSMAQSAMRVAHKQQHNLLNGRSQTASLRLSTIMDDIEPPALPLPNASANSPALSASSFAQGLSAMDSTCCSPEHSQTPLLSLQCSVVDENQDDKDNDTADNSQEQDNTQAQSDPNNIDDSPTRLSIFNGRRVSAAQKQLLASINQFQRRVKKAVIDVWWLYDDGGLGLLVPYLLTLNGSYLQGARLRVFSIASSKAGLEQEQRNMASMLSKFRIEYSDVFVVADITRRPSASTQQEFSSLVSTVRANAANRTDPVITDKELLANQERTHRQLRTRELLLHHSADTATLVVITCPVPRKGACSSALYMSWLEMLTKDMPPCLLLRGNQQSVLTFYS